METRICTRCKIEQNISEFVKDNVELLEKAKQYLLKEK